ncbi:MAG: glycosyltransferase family 2 protein [Pseudomonadota bacterium]
MTAISSTALQSEASLTSFEEQTEHCVATQNAPVQDVSVVIVSYWTGPLLSRCIASVMAQPRVKEIILVDNGNAPHEIRRAKAISPEGASELRILSGHGNIGFAAGCNLGASRATGEYLLFLNPDAALPANGLDTLLEESEGLKGRWLLGGKLVDPDGSEQRGARRRTLTPWTAFVELTQLYRIAPQHPYFRGFNLNAEPCPGRTCQTPVISGACMFLKRADYDAVGGMDEDYFLHVEDVDFCLRFAEAGGAVYYTPHVAVTHCKSSSRVSPIGVERRKAQSMVRYFWKHFRKPYPAAFLVLVSGAVWAAFGARLVKRAVIRLPAYFGFTARSRSKGVKRLRRIAARRSGR